jgi:hypothetical protein
MECLNTPGSQILRMPFYPPRIESIPGGAVFGAGQEVKTISEADFENIVNSPLAQLDRDTHAGPAILQRPVSPVPSRRLPAEVDNAAALNDTDVSLMNEATMKAGVVGLATIAAELASRLFL